MTNQNLRIYTWKKFDIDFYKQLYQSHLYGYSKNISLNTIDLVATLRAIDAEYTTYDINPWRLLVCLGLLAKEKLVDLSLHVTLLSGESSLVYNLTPTNNPYWSIDTFDLLDDAPEPVWINRCGEHHIKRLYVKTKPDAIELLLEKSNYNWVKIWYTEKRLTYKEYTCLKSGVCLPEIPEDVILVDSKLWPISL